MCGIKYNINKFAVHVLKLFLLVYLIGKLVFMNKLEQLYT